MPNTFETLPPGNGYVKTEGLNFRTAPDGDIIRALTIAEPVEVIESAADPRWRKVRIGGVDGYCAARYLRPPETAEVEALIAAAIAQWVRFDRGQASEEDQPYRGYVGEMWRSVDAHSTYDGASTYPNGKDVPWSAVFISFVVRSAGNRYSAFRFASGHSVFVNDAIQARLFERTNRPFWGYRLSERRPQLGDIVARNREGNTYTYDYAETHSQYESHSDIVVEVRDAVIRVLGGNVGDTVTMGPKLKRGQTIQEYRLDAQGFIQPGQKAIAILKNRAAACP